MCQPPEIRLPSADGASGDFGNDGWELPLQQAQWGDVQPTPSDPSLDFLSNGPELMLKLAQEQQRQRADLAALVAMGNSAANAASSWPHQENLTEKLQRAAAAAVTAHPVGKPAGTAAAQLPWLPRQQHYVTPAPAVTPQALWAAAAAAGQPTYMSHLNPGLVAQGIPLSMAQMGHGMMEQSEDDDDPKKHKRMMSNRASAKRSRQRRQERLDELEILSAKLQVENSTVQRRLQDATERAKKFQQENEALQEEVKSLRAMIASKGCALPHGGCPLVEHHHPATKQDSCSPSGSTTDHPLSTPSQTTPPQGASLGKRRREEVGESRSQASESGAYGLGSSGKGQGFSPVTPLSAVTTNSAKHEEKPAGDLEAVVIGQDIGLLDDDIFTSIMEECFEAKPSLEAVLG